MGSWKAIGVFLFLGNIVCEGGFTRIWIEWMSAAKVFEGVGFSFDGSTNK